MAVKVNGASIISSSNVSDVARSAPWYQKILRHGDQGCSIPGPGQDAADGASSAIRKSKCRPARCRQGEWFYGGP